MADQPQCLFSGEPTQNEEHVIPRWMQRRYGLANQTYHLPNGSKIAYRNCKVPAAEAHNGRFGKIEERLATGDATLQEIFLWALKVHIGLIFKDATLRTDIRNPAAGTFWDVEDFGQEVQLFRHLYEVWSNGGWFDPDPFGTVIVVDAITPNADFDFIHQLQSGTLFFQLGRQLIFVSLWDQAAGMSLNTEAILEHHRTVVAGMPEERRQEIGYVAQRTWACETAYFLFRARRAFAFAKTPTSMTLLSSLGRPSVRPPIEAELASFSRSFGLRLAHFGGEVGNVFESWSPSHATA